METIGTRKVGTPRTKLTLKFGNIPLEGRLVRMAAESMSGLSQFSPAGNPIGYRKVDKVTGDEVPNDEILKGKKIGDTIVTFTEDELDGAYAARQAEVSTVRVEDIEDIPATYIKSLWGWSMFFTSQAKLQMWLLLKLLYANLSLKRVWMPC